MKLGVENMLEVYLKDKKRTKDLEAQLDTYNTTINDIAKRIEYIRTNAGTILYCAICGILYNLMLSFYRSSGPRHIQTPKGAQLHWQHIPFLSYRLTDHHFSLTHKATFE